MDAMEAILTRRSTRRFADKPIPKEALEALLRAAMASPTAVNARDWAFLVITDKETLNKMADVNGPAADPCGKLPPVSSSAGTCTGPSRKRRISGSLTEPSPPKIP